MIDEEEQVALGKRRAALIEQESAEHLGSLLNTYGGRFVMWEILSECGVYQTSFRGEATHLASFHQGQQALGYRLLERIFTASPNAYAVMRAENEARVIQRREQEQSQ